LTTYSGQFEVLLVSDEQDVIGDVLELLDNSSTSLEAAKVKTHEKNDLIYAASPSVRYDRPMTPESHISEHPNLGTHFQQGHLSVAEFMRDHPIASPEASTPLFDSPRANNLVESILSRDGFRRLELPTVTPYILTGADEPLSFLSAHEEFVDRHDDSENIQLQPDEYTLISHKSRNMRAAASNHPTDDIIHNRRLASSSTMPPSEYPSYF
jgi:hypothetical protein